MSAIYEKPVITRLVAGLTNKYGSSPGADRKVRKAIDGVPIDKLCEHGSPLFVFSERTLVRTVRRAPSHRSAMKPPMIGVK